MDKVQYKPTQLPENPPTPQAPAQSSSTPPCCSSLCCSKTLLIPIILAVIVLLLGVGYLVGAKVFSLKGPIVVSPQISSSPTPAPDATANWKTLNLDELSFKIPSNWWHEGPGYDATGITSPKIKWVNINPNKLAEATDQPPAFQVKKDIKTFDQRKNEFINQFENFKESSLTLPGVDKATLLEGATKPGFLGSRKIKVAVIQFKDVAYSLEEINLINNHEKFFDQILSTFKFTD